MLRRSGPVALPDLRKCREDAFAALEVYALAHDNVFKLLSGEASFSARNQAGLAFHTRHLAALLHESICLFAKGRNQMFDFYAASRKANPISPYMADSINQFIQASCHLALDQALLIASALVLDAQRSGMHYVQDSSNATGGDLTIIKSSLAADRYARTQYKV
ncbi:hypothetical protein O1611_g10179 [Lasiodiplodia mahajangana]|uniref:Uncharacterized protein n=1 Tax=Lasiodiplodia mahajangana TaxID=1108764 RepID=A0ACC2J162_9PEZI|nr:hypothetical protein O1611_g10179 [Lasiodiplodia mahajangana]